MAGTSASIQRSHFIYRPISEDGFAVDVSLRNKAPHAAVVRLVSVVTEDIVMPGLDVNRWVGTPIHEFRQDVVLVKRLVIDVNKAAADFDDVTGHTDHAFDVRLRGIERIPKNHDVFAMNFLDSINELIDEDPFLVDELG